MKRAYIPTLIILILILFFLAGNFITIPVSYTTTETYTEDVSSTAQVPYTQNVPLKYSSKPIVVDNQSNSIQLVITDTDDTAGTYNANFVFTRVDTKQTQAITKSINLMAGETGVITIMKTEINLGTYGESYTYNFQWTIIPSQKTVTLTRTETTSNPVTKTREVTSQKQVNLWAFLTHSY